MQRGTGRIRDVVARSFPNVRSRVRLPIETIRNSHAVYAPPLLLPTPQPPQLHLAALPPGARYRCAVLHLAPVRAKEKAVEHSRPISQRCGKVRVWRGILDQEILVGLWEVLSMGIAKIRLLHSP